MSSLTYDPNVNENLRVKRKTDLSTIHSIVFPEWTFVVVGVYVKIDVCMIVPRIHIWCDIKRCVTAQRITGIPFVDQKKKKKSLLQTLTYYTSFY